MIEKLNYTDHEDWLKLRHGYIGGSEAGAVVGLNPYKSRYALWAEKVDLLPAFEGNVVTKVGAHLEELIATMFEEETGKKVQRVNSSFHNTDYPYAIANIDRKVVGEHSLLECKSTSSIPTIKQLRKSEFPEIYLAQCTHYLAVTGYDKAYLAVLINCREFKVYELNRDEEEIQALMQAEKDFWQLVETKTPPAIDGEESTSEALSTIFAESNEREVDLSAFKADLREYAAVSDQIKALTKIKDEKANIIKEYMKDADKGRCEGFGISFKTQERRTFDEKKFYSEHKDIDISGCFKTSTSRPLKITVKEN